MSKFAAVSRRADIDRRLKTRERGVSLFIVLIALVLMSFAAVGLIRSVDTASLVSGNVAFKQAATSASDRSANAAAAWLQQTASSSSALDSNNAAQGYYASELAGLDATGNGTSRTRVVVDWNGDRCASAASGTYSSCVTPSPATTDSNGNTGRYLITRMCQNAGDPNQAGNICARPPAGSEPPMARGGVSYSNPIRFGALGSPYFRVIVRVSGPKNTVTFTETFMHF